MRTRTAFAILILMSSGICYAENRIEDAWKYLTKPEDTTQWVVVSVSDSEGFVQCQRYETHLKCPFPVWAKLLPNTRMYAPVAEQKFPYPEIEGTVANVYLTSDQAQRLKTLLAKEGLEFSEIYSRFQNEEGVAVGAGYDIVLTLGLDYEGFENLVTKLLNSVWDANVAGGFMVERDG